MEPERRVVVYRHMLTKSLSLALIASLGVLLSPDAYADELRSTAGRPLSEASHFVQLTVTDGVAQLLVQRTLTNPGESEEEAHLFVDIPKESAVTGLRLKRQEVWYEGSLLRVKRDSDQTKVGPPKDKNWALLAWGSSGYCELWASIPAKGSVVVEYTLTVLASYQGGSYHVAYPKVTAKKPPSFSFEGKGRVEESSDQKSYLLWPTMPSLDLFSAKLGVLQGEQDVIFLKIDTAAQLRPLPKGLSVVFVLDASYSMGEERLKAQLEVAASFLSHVPDAVFEVVVFSRYASRLVGGFAAATEFSATIKRAEAEGLLSLGNGSALEEGLEVAAEALAGGAGPSMIVALSDDAMRKGFRNKLAKDALRKAPEGTLVQLVVAEGSSFPNAFRENNTRASIATATGGFFWRLRYSTLAELSPLTLGLLRPTQLDDVLIKTKDGTLLAMLSEEHTLEEGASLQRLSLLKSAPEVLIVEGKLWHERFRKVVTVDKAFSKATAAVLLSSALYEKLSLKDQEKFSLYGGTLSPVTSYAVERPKEKPTANTLYENPWRMGLRGTCGCGGGYGMSEGTLGLGTERISSLELAPFIKDEVVRCQQAHPTPDNWSARFRVDTTTNEIVDVVAMQHDPRTDCIVEAIWGAVLPKKSFYESYDTFELTF